MQKLEADEMERKTPSKRGAPKRSLEAQVDKLLKDNFRSWGPQQTDCLLRNGMTLRQVLLRDKEKFNKGEVKMGKNYYIEMRRLYEDHQSPAKRLRVANPLDSESDKLRSALYELTSHRCNMKPFLAFLEEDIVDNQRTVVAVLKASLDVKVETSPKHCNIVLEVMRWVKRNGVHKTYASEVEVAKDHFDSALTKNFSFMKKNSVSLDEWWSTHGGIAELVVVRSDWEICMQCKSKWVDVTDTLNAVVTTKIGHAVFGLAQGAIKHNRADIAIAEVIALLERLPAIDAESLRKNKAAFVTKARSLDIDPYETFPKHMVVVTYRRFVVEVSVNSIMEQYTLQVGAVVRTIAVDSGDLPALLVEDELVPPVVTKSSAKVAPDILNEAKAARSAAGKILDALEEVTGEEIAKLLAHKRMVLVGIDPTFKVEEAFWAGLAGERGTDAVQASILACFPDGVETLYDIADTAGRLACLGKSKVFDFCGRGIAAKFTTIQSWVRSMQAGRSPSLDDGCDGPFLNSVRHRLGNFAKYDTTDKDGAITKVVGKKAIDKVFESVHTKKSAGPLSLSDVRLLHIFSFMLDEEQKAVTHTWTEEIIAGDTNAASSSSAAATKNKKGAPKRNAAKKSGPDSRDKVVAGYFS